MDWRTPLLQERNWATIGAADTFLPGVYTEVPVKGCQEVADSHSSVCRMFASPVGG